MNEDRQARLLAEWLEGPEDLPAPQEIDRDVLEALYVIRPERAPAPRVTLADILLSRSGGASFNGAADTWTGETAQETWSEELEPQETWAEEPPSDESLTEVLVRPAAEPPTTDINVEAPPTEIAHRPSANRDEPEVTSPGLEPFTVTPPFGVHRQEATDPGGKVIPFPQTQPTDFPALNVEEPTPPAGLRPQEEPAPVVDLAARRRRWMYISGGVAAMAAAVLVALTVPMGLMKSAPEMAQMDAPEPTMAASPPAEELAEGAPEQLAAAPREKESARSTAANKPANKQEAKEAPTDNAGDAVADLDSLEESRAAGAGGAAPLRADAPPAAPAAEEALAGMDEAEMADAEMEEPALAKSAAVSTADKGGEAQAAASAAKLSAWPGDYDDKWYLEVDLDDAVLERIHQALNEVATYSRYDDYAAASRACEALSGESDVRVAQDFSYRAASFAWKSGDMSRALELVERGIARSSANTPFLSALRYLEGQIRESQGRYEDAQRAYEASAALNKARGH